jgi:hypothetical protein
MSLNASELNLYNLTLANEFTRGYPGEAAENVNQAVAGAWSWLQGQGYLGQKPGARDSSWVAVTPQGRRWHEGVLARMSSSSSKTEQLLESEALYPSALPPLFQEDLGLDSYSGALLDQELIAFVGLLLLLEGGPIRPFYVINGPRLFCVFLFSDDKVSAWLRSYISKQRLDTQEILNSAGLDAGQLPTSLDHADAQAAVRDILSSKTKKTGPHLQSHFLSWLQVLRWILQGATRYQLVSDI